MLVLAYDKELLHWIMFLCICCIPLVECLSEIDLKVAQILYSIHVIFIHGSHQFTAQIFANN